MKTQNDGAARGATRRDLMAMTAVGSLALLLGANSPAWAVGRAIKGHDPRLMPSRDTLWSWLQQLHKFGPVRNTGTEPCRAYEEWLAARFAELGCTIERDQFRLTSWACEIKDCAITAKKDGGGKQRELEVVAYYPYAASTLGKPAVSGRVLYGGVGEASAEALPGKVPAATLAESIVVIDIPLVGIGSDPTTKIFPETFPSPLPPLAGGVNPATDVRVGLRSMAALEGKCRGLILCYTDASKEAVRHNYLPFTDKHRTIPALWVGKPESDYLRSVSGKATVSLRCDARTQADARADTILATLKGESDEVIMMTTQTDGPNECNENGGLGLLAAATYLAKTDSRRRTFVFSLPTGHYAFGPIQDPVTGSGRWPGTRGVLEKWPELAKRTVGQMALEQMGAMEWADVDGKWQPTGRPAREHWIPTPSLAPMINRLFIATTETEDPKLSRSDLIESGFPGGEGGSLRAANLPGIGLMGWPHYFFKADPKGVIDKLSPDVMYSQVSIATKLLVLMDRLSAEQLKGAAPISDTEIFA